jgi:hypothetical protein
MSQTDAVSTKRRRALSLRSAGLPSFVLLTSLFLYRLLFAFPLTPVAHSGDQGQFLDNAFRMMSGEKLYTDFFTLVFPGTSVFYHQLFKAFGVATWIPNAVLVALGSAFAAIGVVIGRRLTEGWRAYVPGLLFLVPFTLGRDASHHYFSALLVAVAVFLLIRSRTYFAVAGAGAACALATWFTQTRGLAALLGLAVFLFWQAKKTKQRHALLIPTVLVASFAAVLVLALIPVFMDAGWHQFYQSTVVFPFQHGRDLRPVNSFEAFLNWSEFDNNQSWYMAIPIAAAKISIYALMPGIFLIALVRVLWLDKSWPQSTRDGVILISLTGIFCWLSVAPSPSFYRLSADSLLAFLVLTWYLNNERAGKAFLAISGSLVLLLMMLAIIRIRPARCVTTPSGRLAFRVLEEAQEWQWLTEHTYPGEYVLDAAGTRDVYWLRVHNPTALPFFTNTSFTTSRQIATALRDLRHKRVRIVLWASSDLEQWDIRGPDPLAVLRAEVQTHYRLVKAFPNVEVYEHN